MSGSVVERMKQARASGANYLLSDIDGELSSVIASLSPSPAGEAVADEPFWFSVYRVGNDPIAAAQDEKGVEG